MAKLGTVINPVCMSDFDLTVSGDFSLLQRQMNGIVYLQKEKENIE